jgi:hypothetical protein
MTRLLTSFHILGLHGELSTIHLDQSGLYVAIPQFKIMFPSSTSSLRRFSATLKALLIFSVSWLLLAYYALCLDSTYIFFIAAERFRKNCFNNRGTDHFGEWPTNLYGYNLGQAIWDHSSKSTETMATSDLVQSTSQRAGIIKSTFRSFWLGRWGVEMV